MPIHPQISQRVDSANRSPDQVRAMEKNKPVPPLLADVDVQYAEAVARENRFYPKAMYKLSVKTKRKTGEKKFVGDVQNPMYPAVVGFDGPRVLTEDLKHWYTTCTVDSAEEEAALPKGWVDHPSKLAKPEVANPEDE